MSIHNFIESLTSDRRFNLQLAAHKYIPPIKPRYMRLDLSESLTGVLKNRGIELFYSHQVEAIDLIRQRQNVLIMTPTASGKSLIYNIPVLESIMKNPEQKALYIFPLKGLEQDQVKNLNELFHAITVADASVSFFKSPQPPFSFASVNPPVCGKEGLYPSLWKREEKGDYWFR